MKFGNDKHSIQKTKHLVIPIGIDGVGEERKSTQEDKIVSLVLDHMKEKTPVKEEVVKENKKLYLNRIINLLYNNKKSPKVSKQKLRHKIWSRLLKWWRKDTTNDGRDLVKFVVIHGLLGAPIVASFLTITNADIPLIRYIRYSIWLVAMLYIIGSGSLYYLFLDVNQALKDNWRRSKK